MANILFVAPYDFNPQMGGVERVTDTLAKELKRKGHSIYYLNLKKHNANNYEIPAINYTFPKENYNHPDNVLYYQDFLQKYKIDIIINQDGLYENSRLFLNVGDTPVKRISVLHSNPIQDYDNMFWDIVTLKDNTYIERIKRVGRCVLYPILKRKRWNNIKKHYDFLYNNTDTIVVLSKSYLNTLSRINQELLTKSVVIENPNSFVVDNLVKEKHNEIICVGRLHKSKKVERLLKIWRHIYNDFPEWRLIIIGDGDRRLFLEDYVNKNNLKNVFFTGFKNPVPYYKSARILASTTNFEGVPMTLTEGMQFGCVPIFYDTFPALSDIVKNGKNGIIIEPFKENKYISALRDLMRNIKNTEELSKAGFQYVKKFNISTIIDKWEAIF